MKACFVVVGYILEKFRKFFYLFKINPLNNGTNRLKRMFMTYKIIEKWSRKQPINPEISKDKACFFDELIQFATD